MDSHDTIDIARQAIHITLLLGAPMLIAGLLVSVIVGLFQSLTQLQDQTLMFVCKLVVVVALISLCLPMLMSKLVDYSRTVIEETPASIGRDP